MEYKSGYLYKLGGVGIFKYRKKYWFVLTKTHIQYYNSSEKLSNPIENYLLTDVKNITLIQKDTDVFNSTIGFIIDFGSNVKFVLQSDTISSVADWVIKVDGLIHHEGDMSETFLDQAERKQLMKILFKNNIKGGIIKTSSSDEEWNYSSIGSLSTEPTLSEEKIDYHWDGEWLKSSSSNSTLGYGRFNGVYLAWFQKDPKIPDIKYFWNEKEREYTTNRKEFTFKWTRHFLASKYSTGEWIVEGHVPQPVVMFLQLIQFKRNPSINNPFTSGSKIDNLSASNDATTSNGSGSVNKHSPLLSSSSSPSSSSSSSQQPPQIDLMSIPQGNVSKASTIKILPYTKGQAMINVSNILFNNSPLDNSNNNNNNLTSSNVSSSSTTTTTSTNSSDEELLVKSPSMTGLIHINDKESKKEQLQFEYEDKGSSIEGNGDFVSISKSNSNSDNKLVKSPITPSSPPMIGSINQTSTLDLLNDTINESSKIQSRLSTKLERLPSFHSKYSDNSLNSIDSINSSVSSGPRVHSIAITFGRQSSEELSKSSNDNKVSSKREFENPIIIPPNINSNNSTDNNNNNNNNLLSSTSTSTSFQSPITTPLGSIVGPSSLSLIAEKNSIDSSNNNNNSNNTNTHNHNHNVKSLINNNLLLGKTQKKPLAKSTSSDKVTSIINQISLNKKNQKSSFCLVCSLVITGHIVVAQGNHFHRECFRCHKCSTELGTKTFYRQVDNLVNQSLNNTNNNNSNSSPSSSISTASSNATSPLGSYNSNNSILNNSNNSNNFVTISPSSPRGLSPSLSSQLLQQQQQQQQQQQKQQQQQHSNNINSIKSNLLSNSHNGGNIPKYLCEQCFNDPCPKCNNIVMYRCVHALGRKWHPDHFTCKHCSKELVGSLYYEKNGFPYCQIDYIKLFPETIKPLQI